MHHLPGRGSRSNTRTSLHRHLPFLLLLFFLGACSTPLGGTDPSDRPVVTYTATDAVIETAAVTVVPDEESISGSVLKVESVVPSAMVAEEDAYVPVVVARAGERTLWARMRAESYSGDAVYLGIDGELRRVFPDRLGAYVWVRVDTAYLDAGAHRIVVRHAEPGLKLDVLAVTTDPGLDANDLEAVVGAPRPGPSPSPSPSPSPTPNPAPSGTSLRGNPDFRISDLPSDAQLWYKRLWAAIDDPGSSQDPARWAASDNLYTYARQLHTHVQTLLIAFRVTGDLRLLDEVDRLLEIMRGKLADSWRGTVDGTDGTRDGYRNWVWRNDENSYTGKDTNKLDEMKTHALVASAAYALHVNRDLTSPSGRSYSAHADFWTDYLVNDFEAKWRDRENRPTGFPIMIRPHTHTYHSWLKWHYYMGGLTGESGYLAEAKRMADVIWNEEIHTTNTKEGPAYLWTRSILSEGGSEDYLHPTTYARYVYGDVVEFHFEGFHRWANPEVVGGFARTFAEFVIDEEHATSSTDWFASDIGGGVSRAGIRSDPSWSRMEIYKFETSPYALVGAWDDTGRVRDVTYRVLQRLGGVDSPRTVYLAAGIFLEEAFDGLSTTALR
jgi:hypothetical protein